MRDSSPFLILRAMKTHYTAKSDKYRSLFGQEFEFINHRKCDGQFNMDFDYQRTGEVKTGKALPMLRLYAWHPWTLSLGYNQKSTDIDYSLLHQKGFGMVCRPTGGRAVLHANELTYSVVLNLVENYSMQDVYRDIHILLVNAFKRLGAALDFERSQPNLHEFYKRNDMSVSCFASAARYEIEYEGRKIVGSAQRLFGRTLLQHGSIILGSGHEEIADIIKADSPQKREALRNYLSAKSSSLSESVGREITYEECAVAIEEEIRE